MRACMCVSTTSSMFSQAPHSVFKICHYYNRVLVNSGGGGRDARIRRVGDRAQLFPSWRWDRVGTILFSIGSPRLGCATVVVAHRGQDLSRCHSLCEHPVLVHGLDE